MKRKRLLIKFKTKRKNTLKPTSVIAKERRKSDLNRRKNFFPTLVLIILIWISVIFFVLLVDPSLFWAMPIFFVLLFTSLVFTSSFVLKNTKSGIIFSIFTIIFLWLRYFEIGNIVNLILLAALFCLINFYIKRS